MSMTEEKPIACSDCRFRGGNFNCYHDQAKRYDDEGEVRWEWRSEMRRWDGVCGRDAKLFEPWPKKTFAEKAWRWFWVLLVSATVFGCTYHFQSH